MNLESYVEFFTKLVHGESQEEIENDSVVIPIDEELINQEQEQSDEVANEVADEVATRVPNEGVRTMFNLERKMQIYMMAIGAVTMIVLLIVYYYNHQDI